MKLLSAFTAAWLSASLCQGCFAQAAPQRGAKNSGAATQSKEQPAFVITPAILERALAFARSKKRLYTDPVDCNAVANVCDRVKIYIAQPSDADGTYCVGLIPESVKFGPANGVQKTIVWEIVPPDPAARVPLGSRFEFYDDKVPAIVVLNDSNPAQLRNGKIGNGNSGNKDPLFYNMKNDHKKKLDAAYLPIIVQRVPPATGSSDPEKVALCGTPDPRILND